MKKLNSFSGQSVLEAAPKKLSELEMERELDHCPAPWKCPAACYKGCAGCAQKGEGIDEVTEMKVDLIRKYGGWQ